jgi:hypothetical protein
MKKILMSALLVAIFVSPAMAALNPDNPNTYLYGDTYLGVDGEGDPDAVFAGMDIDFDGYVGARPGETVIIHMFNNNTGGSPQIGSYRTAFWYDSAVTTRGIERTDWSNTAGTFSNGPYVTNYTGYTMIDRYHGMNSQASIWEGLCVVSWEFTVLETAVVGSTAEIGLQFYAWAPSYAGGYRITQFDANYGALTLEVLPPLSERGDFDLDGDVDADDVDLLFANLGGGDSFYDLTDDGLVDQADVDEWVFNVVPIGDDIGTVYADFNLDGAVDAGDLALLGAAFGQAGSFGWATGDATGDGAVDAGDLALLGGNFGTIVHPVPEPVTMSLLAIGGVTLLRRRK